MSKPLDATRSREVSKEIKSKAKEPFENAYRAALSIPESNYVQGFIVFVGQPYQPLEHSWIELENCIIDPSFPHWNRPPEALHYFPAHRLRVKQLIAAVEEAKEDYPEDNPLPVYGAMPYEYYGEVMLGGKEYSLAYEEALALCEQLNPEEIRSQN